MADPNVFENYALNLAHMGAAGIVSVKVKAQGDAAFYPLGYPRDAKKGVTPKGKADTLGRVYNWGFLIDFSLESIYGSEDVIKCLGALLTALPLTFKIQLTTGHYIISTTNIPLSLKWRLDSGGDMTDFRFVEYDIMGMVRNSELNSILLASDDGSIPADGTPDPGDALYALKDLTLYDAAVPNGISTIEFKAPVDSTYNSFGDFTEGKLIVECVGGNGGGARQLYRTVGLKISLDAKGNQTSLTELALLYKFANIDIDTKLTFIDGKILTLSHTNFHLSGDFDFTGNADAPRYINLKGEGIIPVGTTTWWSGLWT